MPSLVARQVIQICIDISDRRLGILSFQTCQKPTKYFVMCKPLNKSRQLFWTFSIVYTLLINLFEIFSTLYYSKPTNIVVLFYQLFLLLSKIAMVVCFYLFNVSDFDHFFNNISCSVLWNSCAYAYDSLTMFS